MKFPFAIATVALVATTAATAGRADEATIVKLLLKESHWVFVPVDPRSGAEVPVWFGLTGQTLRLHTRDADAPPCDVQVQADGFIAAGCVPQRWRWIRDEPVWPFRAQTGGAEFLLRPASVVPTGGAHGGP